MTAAVLQLALLALALPALAVCAYLSALALLSRPRPAPRAGPPRIRFDVVVPAHDEEGGIARTVASLLAVDYPEALRRVIVVADNCSDATAARARAAGARVLERRDPVRRGKGYALAHAFAAVLADGVADAVVVVDADTQVSPNLLRAFAARLAQGATAVQAHYGVRNPGASWRTRLAAIAFALFHGVRSLARDRLGLSAGLRGNGMCFAAPLLREVPYDAFSVVEDVEYGIRLGEAGHRVVYAPEAHVLGDMPATGAAARLQRRRWEGGRAGLVAGRALPLLRRGLAARDPLLLDLALDLLVPPLAFVAAAVTVGAAASLATSWAAGRPIAALFAWGACAALLGGYVLRGWALSRTGARGLLDLLCAPAYVAWRLAMMLERPGTPRGTWVRTPRDGGTT